MRRSLALSAGAFLLAVPTLSACGFNYATDEIYTPSVGTDIRSSRVDVLDAVIVSATEGEGAFVATFSNNNTKKADNVTAISGGAEDPTLVAQGLAPIKINPGSYVNLADNHRGVLVTGDFKAGDFVTVKIEFGNADAVTFQVPVIAPEGPWADLAPATGNTIVPLAE
jgi:copper(I)-binding protein